MIARTISLPYSRNTHPPKEVNVSDVLALLFKDRAIEKLGRKTFAANESAIHVGNLFFAGLHQCFAEHYNFALSPEVLNYLIQHEVAIAVKKYPERYRHLFTSFEGKQTITIRDDSLLLGSDSNWGRTLGMFEGALQDRFAPGTLDAMMPRLSTYTPESRAATLVSLMDAASPYYDYRVYTRCGIPEIRLLGTPEDYRKVHDSAHKLSEMFQLDLGPYFRQLLPVLEKIAEQADPTNPVDISFWNSIYKRDSGSGGPYITGWITAFLAYSKNYRGEVLLRSAQGLERREISTNELLTYISSVPFIWDYYGAEIQMRFVGGVLGVDYEDGFIIPRLSYAVLHDSEK